MFKYLRYAKIAAISFVFFAQNLSQTYGHDSIKATIKKSELKEDSSRTISLPINNFDNSLLNLTVEIPKTYKIGVEQNNKKASKVEFIPKDESINNWSSMITTSTILNPKIKAEDYVENMITGIRATENIDKLMVISESEKRNKAYNEKSAFMIYYNTKLDCEELLYVRAGSGVSELAVAQYTIRFNSKNSTNRISYETALRAAKKFAAENVLVN